MANILIVDDDPAIIGLVTDTISEHSVMSANNGADGLKLAREKKPDLILLDVSMPKLSGTVVCSRIKSDPELSHIPVIMLTAWGKISDIEEGFSLKADDYIVKPFSPAVLKSRIETLLAGGKPPPPS